MTDYAIKKDIAHQELSGMKSVTRDEFHADLRKIGMDVNSAAIADYSEADDRTQWIVGGRVVGVCSGRVGAGFDYWIAAK